MCQLISVKFSIECYRTLLKHNVVTSKLVDIIFKYNSTLGKRPQHEIMFFHPFFFFGGGGVKCHSTHTKHSIEVVLFGGCKITTSIESIPWHGSLI